MSYPSKDEFEAMSPNQRAFVRKCRKAGLKMISYSGRGMSDKKCPAVVLPYGEWNLRVKVSMDSMGKGQVIYASS